MRIVVVGPCGSGKSTLVAELQDRGYDAHAVAQEHSAVHDLWLHGGRPDVLIFLDASPATITARRQNNFPGWLYGKQMRRLRSAREHATMYLHTDRLSIGEVLRWVLGHLQSPEPAHTR